MTMGEHCPRALLIRLVAIVATAVSLAAHAAGTLDVQKIEPPHWWIGFVDHRLQLLVYGAGISDADVSVSGDGVSLVGVQRTDNADHLFVNLDVAASAKPGVTRLVFTARNRRTTVDYLLKAREPGSAQRRGFDSTDVILNLMPDRFANADPANDTVPGMGDPSDRRDPGGRHGGDLRGVAEHLDYLAGLGVTAIWMTPVVENRQPQHSYHGYAATDLYAVDPRLGTLEDYHRLAIAARSRGIGLIQDVVPNHVGSGHAWLADPPSHDWFNPGPPAVPLTNHARTTVRDPYAAPQDRASFTRGWFTQDMPDLNGQQPLLARYLQQNAIWWIEEMGLVGLRVDTYGYSDAGFLSAWSHRLRREYPHLGMVGEEWSVNPVVVSAWQVDSPLFAGRAGSRPLAPGDAAPSYLPALMDFPLRDALLNALTEPETASTGLERLYEFMVNDRLYADPSRMVMFEGNHDTPRIFSALAHDPDLVRMALAFVLTTRRTPQLYYGDELLLDSPSGIGAFDEFRADFPGGWTGDAVDGFTGRGLRTEQLQLQQWVRRLATWRRSMPAITQGQLMHWKPQDGTYVFMRALAGSPSALVAFNKSEQPKTLETSRFSALLPAGSHGIDIFSGETLDLSSSLLVPARSVRILQIDKPR